MVRQHFTKRGGAHLPRPGGRHFVLECAADAELRHGALPPLPAGAALVAEAAQVLALVAEEIAEARNIETRGPLAVHGAIAQLVDRAVGAETEVVVHQVMAQFPRAAAEAAWPHVEGRPHEEPCAVDGRG